VDSEYRIRWRGRDGGVRWIREIAFPMRDAAGRVTRVGRFARDVTSRKEAEERQAMLMAELNHRVKNTLATVQSLALQTARSGQGSSRVEQFTSDFQARLLALARAHDLLTARTWTGATLADVAAAALAPWRASADGGRIDVGGPAVWLRPQQALGLSLALHELATNAAKHGSLNGEDGRITLEWRRVDRDRIMLEWVERGGPRVSPPARRGFGTRLLERGLPSELGRDARVALRYDPEGFSATISFVSPPWRPETGDVGDKE
jgi:two-component sensor histidine kinase